MKQKVIGRLAKRILVGLVATTLSGCVGTGLTAASVGSLHMELEKERYQKALSAEAEAYMVDHANSPCTNDEDRIIPEIVEYMEQQGRRKGVQKALDRLQEIYEDTNNNDDVRASALYHMAVIYMRKQPPNHYLGIEALKKINAEFPGKYSCIFEDTPWREQMIKKLGIPRELIPEEMPTNTPADS